MEEHERDPSVLDGSRGGGPRDSACCIFHRDHPDPVLYGEPQFVFGLADTGKDYSVGRDVSVQQATQFTG